MTGKDLLELLQQNEELQQMDVKLIVIALINSSFGEEPLKCEDRSCLCRIPVLKI